jgi:membrane protein YdbS with pleckstrin-like domain
VIDALKAAMLRLFKVPPEPSLPAGSAGTARVFRASKRYLQLKLVGWGVGQLMTLIGLVAAVVALDLIAAGRLDVFQNVPHRAIIFRFLGWAEVFGVATFLAQLPLSVVPVILDWEMRWYMVTDRSLRIREGVWRVDELTMTFANVQEVSIRQGPVERLFGISNLRVRTAGGGGGRPGQQEAESEERSGHVGYFRGVDNAPVIRDLILERLKRLRDAGLGDPDQASVDGGKAADGPAPDPLGAARELLGEAHALRRAVAP